MWIAVLGSVRIFPNLEAALKGVFNRVLNFFPNASAKGTPGGRCEVLANVPMLNASHFQAHGEPLLDISAHRTVSMLFAARNNGDTGDVLRAAAKPGLAIKLRRLAP